MLTRRALLWLVPFFMTIHNLEEMAFMPGFLSRLPAKLPGWLVHLFPPGVFPPTYRQYLVMILIATLLPYAFALLPGAARPRGLRTYLLVGLQMVMLINVFSHVISMDFLNSYVPGLATALLFNLAFSIYFFSVALRQGWLRLHDFAYLVPFALIAHGPGLLGLTLLAGRLTAS